MKRASRFAPPDRRRPEQQDVAGIEPLGHIHHRHAARLIARLDGRLDRRGSAPAREERGVQIQAGHPRGLEHGLRQYLAVSHDDNHVRPQRHDLGHGVRRAHPHRLQHRHAALHGELFDRRRPQFQLPPGGFVRLADRGHDFAPRRREQPAKGWHADLARPHENDPHPAGGGVRLRHPRRAGYPSARAPASGWRRCP